MTTVIVLRPQPGADSTARKARTMGLAPHILPLFEARPVDWVAPPADDFDALLLTSANAARLGGDGLCAYTHLPIYAVGPATAAAIRTRGVERLVEGTGDGSAIAARIVADGHRAVLHLGGTTLAPMESGSLHMTRIAVYSMAAAVPPPDLAGAVPPGAILLVHSPRAGGRLAALVPDERRGALHLVAISPAALAACGTGWASGQSADRPLDEEMLALAARLCEGRQRQSGKGSA